MVLAGRPGVSRPLESQGLTDGPLGFTTSSDHLQESHWFILAKEDPQLFFYNLPPSLFFVLILPLLGSEFCPCLRLSYGENDIVLSPLADQRGFWTVFQAWGGLPLHPEIGWRQGAPLASTLLTFQSHVFLLWNGAVVFLDLLPMFFWWWLRCHLLGEAFLNMTTSPQHCYMNTIWNDLVYLVAPLITVVSPPHQG